MKRFGTLSIFVLGLLFLGVAVRGNDDKKDDRDRDDNRVALGLELSPVPLHVTKRNRELVGLGSYIVNAQGGCNDCHTCPSYKVNPFTTGQRKNVVNSANYLAGGVAFNTPGGTFVSPNLTPDPSNNNLPDGGHTFEQFKSMMRTGHDAEPPHAILQVMPWPVYGNMSDEDLRAVYEFMKAIPHAEAGHFFGGTCPAPGLAKPPV
jgi:hypothetical protein